MSMYYAKQGGTAENEPFVPIRDEGLLIYI